MRFTQRTLTGQLQDDRKYIEQAATRLNRLGKGAIIFLFGRRARPLGPNVGEIDGSLDDFRYFEPEMPMEVSVFLADLRHDYSGVLASNCMPLGIAYMKAVMDRDGESDIKSRLFVYPDRLLSAIKSQPPNVLMLTNYAWNEALMRFFVSTAKAIDPNILTVVGGPNLPLEPDRRNTYLNGIPDLDIYVVGEGDFVALDIVHQFMDSGLRVSRLSLSPLPSSCIVRTTSGVLGSSAKGLRQRELDLIPSPWLTGIQDEFFDGRLAPMIETNRGCPFTCTFCVQGTDYYTKVAHFSVDRLKEELLYIAKRRAVYSPSMALLRIADSNYGMFERDIGLSEYIGYLQRDYGWPLYIDATTGKNRADRVIASVEKVSGALVLYQAVQSLDEEVLRNIKRQNIKLAAYNELQVYMRGRGLKSVSDLILGLPGETLESHLNALNRLIDSDIDQLHNMQAMLLKGSELETSSCRETFRFETRFRLVPKAFGSYDGSRVFDTEEIVVATDTFSFEDYLVARKWHLISSLFWNNGWFSDLVCLARAFDVPNSKWWRSMLPAMELGADAVRAFIARFLDDTNQQLFVSREECESFYARDENFEMLRQGEVGDNLMYRYRAIASFFIWDDICQVAVDATRELLIQHGAAEAIPDFDDFFTELGEYVRLSHAKGTQQEELFATDSALLNYDFRSWLRSGRLKNPGDFRHKGAIPYRFVLSESNRHELQCALSVWTTNLYGLSKLITRVSTHSQTRDCIAA